MKAETCKVKNGSTFVIINKSDFVEGEHELYRETVEEPSNDSTNFAGQNLKKVAKKLSIEKLRDEAEARVLDIPANASKLDIAEALIAYDDAE